MSGMNPDHLLFVTQASMQRDLQALLAKKNIPEVHEKSEY